MSKLRKPDSTGRQAHVLWRWCECSRALLLQDGASPGAQTTDPELCHRHKAKVWGSLSTCVKLKPQSYSTSECCRHGWHWEAKWCCQLRPLTEGNSSPHGASCRSADPWRRKLTCVIKTATLDGRMPVSNVDSSGQKSNVGAGRPSFPCCLSVSSGFISLAD